MTTRTQPATQQRARDTRHLDTFFQELKSMHWWKRLFAWKAFQALSLDAYAEAQNLKAAAQSAAAREDELQNLQRDYQQAQQNQQKLELRLEHQQGLLQQNRQREGRLEAQIADLERQIQAAQLQLRQDQDKLEHSAQLRQELHEEVLSEKAEIKHLKAQQEQELRHLAQAQGELQQLREALTQAQSQGQHRLEKLEQTQAALSQAQAQRASLEAERDQLRQKLQYHESRTQRQEQDMQSQVQTLAQAQAWLSQEREQMRAEEEAQRQAQLEAQAQAWKAHEDRVRDVLAGIAQRHTVHMLQAEEWPDNSRPDAVLRIAEEMIVFDAKCPQAPELSGFAQYVQTAAKQMNKYAKVDGVRQELYLVVPAETLGALKDCVMDQGKYRVFVVTPEMLESLIINLKRIEDYEFAEQLSPEDRAQICSVIGRFRHLTKRRVMIDADFNKQLFQLLQAADELPDDFEQEIAQKEKVARLKLSSDRPNKVIPLQTVHKAQQRAERNIQTLDDGDALEDLVRV